MANRSEAQGSTSTSWMRATGKRCTGPLTATAMVLTVVLSARFAQGQAYTETVLHSFAGGTDGASPRAGLIRDTAGNLYGTTANGGNTTCNMGCGTVYEVSSTGKETVLYSFAGYPDGANPYGGLVRDATGNIFGTTSGADSNRAGTVFKLDTTDKETVLCSFSPTEGGGPRAGLALDTSGNLYGTHPFLDNGYGAVYEVSANGQESTLYSFSGGTGPEFPIGGLVLDATGTLYGTTYEGGLSGCGCCACGTLFEFSSVGLNVLHNFAGYPTDGGNPVATLLRDTGGNLYGTTPSGGAYLDPYGFGYGTVFKLDTTGNETVLYNFTGGPDGGYPLAGLVKDAKGNLYGTTSVGGASGQGTVFELDATGKETVLYSFTGGTDGGTPYAGAILDAAENLYGTTLKGGAYGYGTVFELAKVPTVRLIPKKMAFVTQLVGTTSPTKTATLTNTSNVTLNISLIFASGDFSSTYTCMQTLAPHASCGIFVSFKPSVEGTRTGTLSVTDDAAGSPQTVSLSGIGTVVELSPTALNFGSQMVGTKSTPQNVTLTNTGSSALQITHIGTTGSDAGDFRQINTCGTQVAAGSTCTITVTFTPLAQGQRTAKISISDNGGGSPQMVALTGTGT